MVGLKTFWITISALFLLGACVPQSKQTKCRSNEAFNASLRTCVPVVGGPSSFINIDSFAPVSSITKYKNDATTITFEVVVSNPYNQSYTVSWERVFNGTSVSMCSNAPTCSFPASLLGTVLGEVGTHVLIAKIKDANGTTVDSHNFEIRIVDLPKPIINSASLTPSSYAPGPYYPTDPRIQFSFSIKNNGAVFNISDNYRTVWSVQKNGATIYTESDSFSNTTPTGTNTAYLGTAPTPYFNPATLDVGSYIIRATVQNDVPGEVVDEQQWSIIIQQPALTNVSNVSLPSTGITTLAHNNVDYNDYPTESWVYSGTQPQFCVTLTDRDGTYPSDGDSVLVQFYLDGAGGNICTKKTLDSPGVQTVCLFDANPCEGNVTASNADAGLMNALKFANSSASVSQNHTVVARVIDERTNLELTPSNVSNPAGMYPIAWTVLVNPINTAPKVSFSTPSVNVTNCVVSGAFSRSNCTVNQGELFTLRFTVDDDFYDPATEEGEFRWDIKLKLNGADISTPPKITSCSKALAAVAVPAYSTTPGALGWECTMEVPHYIASGPLDPIGPFQVVVTMEDSGSEVGGTSMQSQSLTWNLVVNETNSITPNITLSVQDDLAASSHIADDTGPTYFDPAGSNFASELDTVTFRLAVRDPELDDFTYNIYRCGSGSTAVSCVSPVSIASSSYIRAMNPALTLPFTDTTNTDPVLINALLYQLPETLLLDAGSDVDTSTPTPVYFKVDIADMLDSLPSGSVKLDSEIFTLWVTNFNEPPVINTAGADPEPNTAVTAYPVMAGFPFTINPGAVTDASTAVSEKTLEYRWYASGNGGTSWSPVATASTTSPNLTWTPDHSAPAEIRLKLCVGDQTAANPILAPGTAGANCSTDTWFIAPKSFLVSPTPVAGVNLADASVNANGLAVWNDEFDNDPLVDVIYSAYVGDDNKIYVNKTVRDSAQALDVSSFQTISFDAIDGGSDIVTGLSIAGTTDSLYIAYGASSSSTPATLLPRLRRIDKSFGAATVGEKTNYPHKGKFGFSYTDTTIDVSACTNCSASPVLPATQSVITINSTGINGIIDINGVAFTPVAAPATDTEVCSQATCSANDGADSLASKINGSTNPLLQGITAFASGNTVTIHRPTSYDSLLINTVIGNGGIGKIFIVGGYWFLPIINSSIAGPSQNNITVLSGEVDKKLLNNIDVNASNVLTDLGAVGAFDAQLSSTGALVIAAIRGDLSHAGKTRLARFELSGTRTFQPFMTPAVSVIDIFGTRLFEEIKLAANATGNTSLYVLAKERTSDGGEYNVGRYAADLSGVPSEHFLTDRIVTTDDTSDFISNTLMTGPVLVAVPNSSDARVFFNSVGTPSGDNATRVARWKSDNTFTCGICAPIGLEDTNSIIAVSNVVANTTIGTTGFYPNENQKDVVLVLTNSLVGTEYQPQLGLINLEPETIQSTTVDSTNHLFRPPFAK